MQSGEAFAVIDRESLVFEITAQSVDPALLADAPPG